MNGKPTSTRTRPWIPLLVVLCASAACSTMNVKLEGTAGDGMNPNRVGGSGALRVYVFFLKRPDAFNDKGKLQGDFLCKSVVDERKAPAFLEKDIVGEVEYIELPPAVTGKPQTITKTVEVAVEATCVGLVAAFQGHRDNDDDEVWRLPLSISGGAVSFEVTGRRLAEHKPPPPKPKETPRASSSDG